MRKQASGLFWTTPPSLFEREDGRLMYRIALLYLALCLLASLGLKPLSAEDPAAGKPAAKSGTKWKKEDFQPAEACKTCHPQHYEEWRGSMHAYAITDPVFHAMHRLSLIHI